MKRKKQLFQIILDVILTVTFISFFSIFFTGLELHELLGIGIAVLFLVHNLLNYRWIVAVSKNLFNRRTTLKTKVGYLIDFLLLVAIAIILITGIKISKTIFVGAPPLNYHTLTTLHKATSYITLGLIGIHVGLHIGFISAVFKKVFCPSEKVREALVITTTIVCLAAGIFGVYKTDYFRRIIPVTKTEHIRFSDTYEEEGGEIFANFENLSGEGYRRGGIGGGRGFGGEGAGHGGGHGTPESNVFYSLLVMLFFASFTFAFERFLFDMKPKKRISAHQN